MTPTPTEVVLTEPELSTKQNFIVATANFLLWFVRALIVWGFFAVFFPALGVTYVLVLAALWALRHALPTDQERIHRLAAKQ